MKRIFYNGDIITMDGNMPSATAVLTDRGRIIRVGSDSDILLCKSADTVCINLKKKTVLPGFIDGHSHFALVAKKLMFANLSPSPEGACDSIELLVEMGIRAFSRRNYSPDEWFIGAGFDNSVFEGGIMPTRNDLDRISRTTPVLIFHFSGKIGVVNSCGLSLLGIDRNFKIPDGGNIGRFPGREPNGQLFGKVFRDVSQRIKLVRPAKYMKAVKKASQLYASRGITSVSDGDIDKVCYPLLRTARTLKYLPQDIVCYAAADSDLEPNGDKSVPIIGLKLFLDGTPMYKTAWLKSPYLNPPKGENAQYRSGRRIDDEELITEMEDCLYCSVQFNVHACGDAAVEQAIRCYAEAKKRRPDAPDIRPVLIHCQLLGKDSLAEMKRLGMRASFLIDHLYYRGDIYAGDIIGIERTEKMFPLKSAARSGVPFTLHQDSPALLPDVFRSIQTSVCRTTVGGNILGQDEKLTVYEALKAVTTDAAEQIFAEDKKGSITPGKDADFIICDRNPLTVSPETVADTKVLTAIKGGHVIYSK